MTSGEFRLNWWTVIVALGHHKVPHSSRLKIIARFWGMLSPTGINCWIATFGNNRRAEDQRGLTAVVKKKKAEQHRGPAEVTQPWECEPRRTEWATSLLWNCFLISSYSVMIIIAVLDWLSTRSQLKLYIASFSPPVTQWGLNCCRPHARSEETGLGKLGCPRLHRLAELRLKSKSYWYQIHELLPFAIITIIKLTSLRI